MRVLGRVGRLSTFLAVVLVVVGLLGARRARARAAEGALAIGEQMLDAAPADASEAHELLLNGHAVHVASARTSLPLGAVLDRFEAQCDDHADGMAKDLRTLGTAIDASPAREGFPGIGVLRDVREGRGVIVCFATGGPTDTTALAGRLERFAETHDLADLGHMRYVAARTLAGEDGGTLVVATWTDESLPLDALFPAVGDAAGTDPQAALRPENARRLLSARDGRSPYGVYVYEVDGMLESIAQRYEASMKTAGWSASDAVRRRAPDTRAFSRPGVDVVITFSPGLVSIVEMPARAGR